MALRTLRRWLGGRPAPVSLVWTPGSGIGCTGARAPGQLVRHADHAIVNPLPVFPFLAKTAGGRRTGLEDTYRVAVST